MNPFKKAVCRIFQKTMKFFQNFISFPIPETIEKENAVFEIPGILKRRNLSHPLFLCGNHAYALLKEKGLFQKIEEDGLKYDVFTEIKPDPQVSQIDDVYAIYQKQGCDSLVAIGGGSIIDATKALGIRIAYPKTSLKKFRGFLKVHKKIPFFIAVPTTAGTGSEATVCAVITDGEDKFAINDPHLIPEVCMLEESLLSTLPPMVIANTGMDAFTHAIEAFLGHSNTKMTKEYALSSMKAIHENLISFFHNPSDQEARKAMLKASYEAGISFTRAYVGYVHALAHAIGGCYHVPHGYAIAILLPYVLEAYGSSIYKDMSTIYDSLDLGKESSNEKKAKAVIQWVKDTNAVLGIPSSFQGLIDKEKYNELAKHADKEANPFYPVPKELDSKELRVILVKANHGTR